MKSLMFLWRAVADESATICHTSATLDYKKLESRVEHEGVSFLTLTLPLLGRALEAALESGVWDPSMVPNFRHRGGLPLFLGGFLDHVFDRGTGRLQEQPCVDSIFALRQLTLMFKKILLPVSDSRERDAMHGYVAVEEEVRQWTWNSPEQESSFVRVGSLLWADVFQKAEESVYTGDILPRHGPGATADGLSGNQKYVQREWPVRLDNVFSVADYVIPNHRHYAELDHVDLLEPGAERPVKVISVPKTLKTPRIISVEPTCMQFMQQGIARVMYEEIENHFSVSKDFYEVSEACCDPFGFVGFRSQDPNRAMAKRGSLNGELATLDMSEASDRVANLHVVSLLSRWPWLSEAVQACRSTKADVPGHGIISLSKFASMGSALTFPLEAVIFTTAIFLGIEQVLGRQLTLKDVKSFKGKVRVFGDDIIVPTEYVYSVIDQLEGLGLKVNKSKSFWNGKFRESCGGDYYDGHWVTPVYVRRKFPTSLRHVSEIESLVALRNQFYFAGYWKTARHLDKTIARILPRFPIVEPSSTILGRHSFLSYRAEKMSSSTHGPLVKGYESKYQLPPSPLDGVGALYKCLSSNANSAELSWLYPESTDDKHLERAGRGRAVGMKLVWRPPY